MTIVLPLSAQTVSDPTLLSAPACTLCEPSRADGPEAQEAV